MELDPAGTHELVEAVPLEVRSGEVADELGEEVGHLGDGVAPCAPQTHRRPALPHTLHRGLAGDRARGRRDQITDPQSSGRRGLAGVPTYDTLGDLIASGVDAVTITTPPTTRRDLVLEALGAGVHVVADKPFAPTADVARELAEAADAAGVLLTVFHNRRWDADVRTLAAVLAGGKLGDLWRVHSRFDFDDPGTLEAGPGGGLLRDIGSHVVDQMLWLLGPVRSVTAHVDLVDLPEGPTDAGFTIDLLHETGVRSYVESSKINHVVAREFRAYGSKGCYQALGTDVQAQAIFAGRRPAEDPRGWGYDAREHWGILTTAAGHEVVPSEQGRYHDLYTQFAAAVRGEAEQPVPASEGIRTLEVLDAARESARRGASVSLTC